MKILSRSTLVLCLFSISCSSQDKSESFEFGTVENKKYVNEFFNFKMDLPNAWVILTSYQLDSMKTRGRELLSTNDRKIAKKIKPSSVTSADLIGAFQNKLGAAVDFNANFAITVENVAQIKEIKTGKDFLLQLRSILERSQIQFDSIDKEFMKRDISGQEFYIMTASKNMGYLNVRQTNYVTVKKGFVFNLTISYANESQRVLLEQTINSMTFN